MTTMTVSDLTSASADARYREAMRVNKLLCDEDDELGRWEIVVGVGIVPVRKLALLALSRGESCKASVAGLALMTGERGWPPQTYQYVARLLVARGYAEHVDGRLSPNNFWLNVGLGACVAARNQRARQ